MKLRIRPTLLVLAALGASLSAAPDAAASLNATWRARPLRVLPQAPLSGVGSQVRIEGVMAFTGDSPMGPRCGAIDFFCRAGDPPVPGGWCTLGREQCERLCRMAWQDIAAAARAGQCVAFDVRLWMLPMSAVKPLGSPFADPNPFDPIMGVSIVPCRPESPSSERPDLTLACADSVDAAVPGPDPATKDAAPGDEDPDAEQPLLGTGGSSGAGGAAAAPTKAAGGSGSTGCSLGGGSGSGPLVLGAFALPGLLVRRRRPRRGSP